MRNAKKHISNLLILIICLAYLIGPAMGSSIGTTIPSYPVSKGDELVIRGSTTGSTGEVALWIFGRNWYERGTATVGPGGNFEYTLPGTKTSSMAAGKYYVIAQHPGSNGIYDVIEDKTTAPGITYVRIRGTTSTVGADAFRVEGIGRLQGSDAAEALIHLIGMVDDFSTIRGIFNIEEPWIRINKISDKEAGSILIISGTTNIAAGNELLVEVIASSQKPTTKTLGSSGILNSAKIVRASSGYNTWSMSLDSTGFISDEYIILVESINFDSTATTTFNILQSGPSTPTPLATVTAKPTSPPVTPIPQPPATATPTPVYPTPGVIGAVTKAKAVSASVELDNQNRGIIRWQGGADIGSVISWRGMANGEMVVEGKSIGPGDTITTNAPISGSRFTLIAQFQDGSDQIILERKMGGYYQPVATTMPSTPIKNQADPSSGPSEAQETVRPDSPATSTPATLPLIGDLGDTDRMVQVGFGIFLITVLLIGVILSKSRKPAVKTDYQLYELKRSNAHANRIFARVSKREDSMDKNGQSQLPKRMDQLPKAIENFPRELRSRYNPLEFIGEGGFAKVYKVKRQSDDQIVAVKIPRIDEKTSGIFIKEVAAWYHLSHMNIVKLYSSDILPIPHLEMEYIDGIEINGKLCRDLDSLDTPIPLNRAIQITYDISKGVAYAHQKGIYHHDLKLLNVLITSGSVPKIADFGLSKVSSRSSMTTNKGYSPLYAAPEQLDSDHYGTPDQRTDLYHLGLIFYELLTGTLPYDGPSPGVIIGKIVSESTVPLSLAIINPDLADYDSVVGKLIAKRMENRFQNVSEFQEALKSVYLLNKEKKNLLEDLKLTKDSLRKSTGKEDIKRLTHEAIRKSVRIALLHAQLNDRVELITALNEIRLLTSHHKEDLDAVIDQLQYMIAEDLPPGNKWVEQLRILLGKIEMQG